MAFCGCYLLWLLAALLKAQPDWEGTPQTVLCQKLTVHVSCRGRGLSAFPRGLGHDVMQLDVSHNFIFQLTDGDMAELGQLRQLNLRANKLQGVSEGALKPLHRLHTLILATNRFFWNHVGNGKAFESLQNLVVLDLSENGLDSDMVASYLRSLPSLEELDLSRNHVIRLPAGLFRGTPNLRELHLKNNGLVEIEEEAFGRLEGLRVLNLAMNSLCCISEFSLTQLHILNLSYNALEFFVAEGGTTKEARYHLQALDLSYNHLASLPLLPRRNGLTHLNLSHNSIRLRAGHSAERGAPAGPCGRADLDALWGLPNKTLRLTKVVDLDLSNNQLRSFPAHLLSPLRSLRTLSLAWNCLWEDLSVELPTGTACTLQSPYAGRKGGRERQGPRPLPVRNLDLRGNAIRSLPPSFFAVLPDLGALDLGHNHIRLCRAWDSNPRALHSAERGACMAFCHIPQLKHLSLRKNNLVEVHSHLFNQTPLSSLDLSANEGLYVAEGALESLGPSLQALSLKGSLANTSGARFACLQGLKVLDLSENRLGSLPPGLLCPPLEELDLRENSLPWIEEAAAVHLAGSLRRLSVAGNPFRCCDLKWLAILDAAGVGVLDVNETLCSYSEGNKLFTVPVGQAPGGRHCFHSMLRVSLAVVAVLCAVALSCGACCLLKKYKKRMLLSWGFASNWVEPLPYPRTKASGQPDMQTTETTKA